MYKPRLLRETAEIALTEVKRFLEPRLAEEFGLRRVSAPLYFPAGKGLNGSGEPVTFTLPSSGEKMEIATGLDPWLRTQLDRYDIAPGFGVFTVMTALRPWVPENATRSPQTSAWAWQQAIEPESVAAETLVAKGTEVYRILEAAEEMILERFPHLTRTLPAGPRTVAAAEIARRREGAAPERLEYEYLREHHSEALLVTDDGGLSGRLVIWNDAVGYPVTLADVEVRGAESEGGRASAGGNIYRDQLALQILHQAELLR
ncbi:MAG: hypothetical protein NC210_10345 [[Clostridium] fimetarium]|nr:hypothetical protein [Alistipes timonensis]MCM1406812.1 hypothetical protein [[Clostridium] fimetarium]